MSPDADGGLVVALVWDTDWERCAGWFGGGGIAASSSGGAGVFGAGLGLSVLRREARPGRERNGIRSLQSDKKKFPVKTTTHLVLEAVFWLGVIVVFLY